MNDDNDETDFPEAVDAERVRLWPKGDIRETEQLARNLFVARVASDRNISLASALKIIKAETPIFQRIVAHPGSQVPSLQ